MNRLRYYFDEVNNCAMCGQASGQNRILGQRLNQSQGMRPKLKLGISTTVMKCTNCDLIYANPQPIPFSIQDHYGIPPEEYWKEAYFQWDSTYFAREISIAKELMQVSGTPRALDIGAGLGKSMISMHKAGFDVWGLEPSIPFRKKAIEKMGIPEERLKLGMVEELEYPENFFDFITFGAVLEHLYNPADCIERSLKWLKPGGLIQIEVPSSAHFIPRLLNAYYRLIGTNYVTNLSPMHEPFHMYEFGLQSFQELARRFSFEIARHEYFVCDIYHVPRLLHPLFRWYMKKTNTGMQLSIWLRKV